MTVALGVRMMSDMSMRVKTPRGVLVQVTASEALAAVRRTYQVDPGSPWEHGLVHDPMHHFDLMFGDRSPPLYVAMAGEAGLAAIGVYLAIRSGMVVMREETDAERAEREDNQAYAIGG